VYLKPPNLRWNGTKGSVHDVSQKGWTYAEIDVGGVAVAYFRV